jgi:hypothetical protein
MKKEKMVIAVILVVGASAWAYAALNPTHNHATCYGKNPCNACSNCKYCGHCAKNGGSCGACR